MAAAKNVPARPVPAVVAAVAARRGDSAAGAGAGDMRPVRGLCEEADPAPAVRGLVFTVRPDT